MIQHVQKLLEQLLKFEHPTDQILSKYYKEHRQLGARDRATISDTVYSVIRELMRFKNIIKHTPGLNEMPLERKLAILAWAGDNAWLEKKLSTDELNWLKGAQQREENTIPFSERYSLPEWLLHAVEAQIGASQIEAFARSMLQTASLDLRVNTLKDKREQVRAELLMTGVHTDYTPYAPNGLRLLEKSSLLQQPLYQQGVVEIQDEGSQLLACLVGAKRNEIIIDYCAGAGGKTLALGASMRNTGRLYAWDISAHRLDAIKPRLQRSGLTNVHTAAITNAQDERVRRFYGKADRVLVDAPCSGLGTLRRSPELKWRITKKDVVALAQAQLTILAQASNLVKVGGLLVYATCSVLQEENEVIARQFTQMYTQFKPLNVLKLLEKQKINESASLVQNDYLRLWPHLHKTDGFFAAVWERCL